MLLKITEHNIIMIQHVTLKCFMKLNLNDVPIYSIYSCFSFVCFINLPFSY